MESLAQIERVIFLQGVGLFSHCTAAQILRVAAIAKERHFDAGETIYGANDPADSIHCVVEGKVALEKPSRDTAVIEKNDTFGVIDLLSGRLRDANATAEVGTLTLAIDADDFFDLLSNNIDIVKALFRFLCEEIRA